MTEPSTTAPFRLAFTADRRIDIAALEQVVTEQAMRDWMLARFEGRDELLAVDEENRETPQRVFIDLWNRADSDGNVRKYMQRACKALLSAAVGAPPQDWMEPLLALVATIHPSECKKSVRTAFCNRVFENPRIKEAGLDRRWLEAASAYGLHDLAAIWLELMAKPEYATTAYYALCEDADSAAFYLPDYYEGLSAKSRYLLLKQAIRYMLRKSGAQEVRKALRCVQSRSGSVPGLCHEINRVLEELGLVPVMVEDREPGISMEGFVESLRNSLQLLIQSSSVSVDWQRYGAPWIERMVVVVGASSYAGDLPDPRGAVHIPNRSRGYEPYGGGMSTTAPKAPPSQLWDSDPFRRASGSASRRLMQMYQGSVRRRS